MGTNLKSKIQNPFVMSIGVFLIGIILAVILGTTDLVNTTIIEVYDQYTKWEVAERQFVNKVQMFVCIQLLVAVLFMIYVMWAYYHKKLVASKWEVLKQVKIEIQIIGFLILYYSVNHTLWWLKYIWRVAEIRDDGIFTITIFMIRLSLCSVLLISILALLGVEIIYIFGNGKLEFIKENSILWRHRAKYKQIAQSVYSVVSIRVDQNNYKKLLILQVIHIILLIIFALVWWQEEVLGVILLGCYSIVALSIGILRVKDFKNLLLRFNQTSEIQELGRRMYIKIVFEVIGYILILGLLASIAANDDRWGLLWALIIGILITIWKFYNLKQYKEIYAYVRGITTHNPIPKPQASFLSPIINELEQINENFTHAVNQEVISERMKTELISNVSHDLKTPLTSIINYVDLLKNEDLSKEAQREYIRILDQKSQRLKVLIEDLFEASKAASGNLELMTEKIDVVALIKQTLGELEEKISVSTLQFKVNMPEEKVICELDGRRTYRVFENLISNILKYSAPNSRVYIDCVVEEEVSIIFKNMSAYEMNFSAEEITERFKRGDEARHTEGSGLGLAIAKNLTQLQGGRLEIVIDGDLFKVIVKFKKED